MRRRATWLCLLLALAAPFVSEARAAYGLGLSLAEIGHNVLESAQEDADEAYDGQEFVAVTAHAPAGIDVLTAFPPTFDFLTTVFLFELPPSAFHAVRHRHGQWHWPPPTAQKRHAFLQTFLF